MTCLGSFFRKLLYVSLIALVLLFLVRTGLMFGGFASNDGAQTFLLQGADLAILGVILVFGAGLTICFYWGIVAGITSIIKSIFRSPSAGSVTVLNLVVALFGVLIIFGAIIRSSVDYLLGVAQKVFASGVTSFVWAFKTGATCLLEPGQAKPFGETCLPHLLEETAQAVTGATFFALTVEDGGGIDPVRLAMVVVFFVAFAVAASKFSFELDSVSKFWTGYVTVAIFSIYLALSAILAVALLSGDASQDFADPEDLQSILALSQPDQFDQLEEASALSATFLTELDPETELSSAQSGEVFTRLTELSNALDDQKTRLERQQDQLFNGLQSQLNTLSVRAVHSYRTGVMISRGKHEASRHFRDIETWFAVSVQRSQDLLHRCETAHSNLRVARADLRKRLLAGMGQQSKVTRAVTHMSDSQLLDMMDRAIDDANLESFECDTSQRLTHDFLPQRRNFGSSLGLAGLAAGWLLATESMQVTLLTGLIGFGLLGALVAQFVKHPIHTQSESVRQAIQTHQTYYEIAIVVFTGFCAAIIVYVASYGGLAIAAASESDPNPYFVFGACLVGAVYSNVIWGKAKGVFLGVDAITPPTSPAD